MPFLCDVTCHSISSLPSFTILAFSPYRSSSTLASLPSYHAFSSLSDVLYHLHGIWHIFSSYMYIYIM